MQVDILKLRSIKEDLEYSVRVLDIIIGAGLQGSEVRISAGGSSHSIPFDETAMLVVKKLAESKQANLDKVNSAIDTAQKVINGLLAD